MRFTRLLMAAVVACGLFAVIPATGHADAIFTFTEEGGRVVMRSSGTLDTTKLISVSRTDGWGNVGTEHNGTPGDIDIMGGTTVGGAIDAQFGFTAGTDFSAITNPGGPFQFSNFSNPSVSGNKAFTTYSGFINGFRMPGIGITRTDIVNGLWTPDQQWTYAIGSTFASLGLNAGTWSVSDIKTGETITIQIGAVPEPGTIALLGLGLAGIVGLRRRRK